MCFFCCDILCWFSFLTCCGCRDIVARKLVFFPPKPYYFITDKNDTKALRRQYLQNQKPENENENENENETGDGNEAKAKLSNDNNDNNNDEQQAYDNSVLLEIAQQSNNISTNSSAAVNNAATAMNMHGGRQRSERTQVHVANAFENKLFWIKDDDPFTLSNFLMDNFALNLKHFHFQYLSTAKQQRIASYFIEYPNAKYTILFSHGNAADIGLMRNHLCLMQMRCKCNIFAYEYSGYGQSTGKASETNSYADIEAAYKYIVHTLQIAPHRLIAYGQSLGTCVSVYLACHFPVAGVILHSPLMSGLRVMQQFDKTFWFDIYPVVDQIQQVFAPVFVIHGRGDTEIAVIHGKILSRIAPNSYEPWFVHNAGHNDIEILFPQELFFRVNKFIKYLQNLERVHTQLLAKQPQIIAAERHRQQQRRPSPNRRQRRHQSNRNRNNNNNVSSIDNTNTINDHGIHGYQGVTVIDDEEEEQDDDDDDDDDDEDNDEDEEEDEDEDEEDMEDEEQMQLQLKQLELQMDNNNNNGSSNGGDSNSNSNSNGVHNNNKGHSADTYTLALQFKKQKLKARIRLRQQQRQRKRRRMQLSVKSSRMNPDSSVSPPPPSKSVRDISLQSQHLIVTLQHRQTTEEAEEEEEEEEDARQEREREQRHKSVSAQTQAQSQNTNTDMNASEQQRRQSSVTNVTNSNTNVNNDNDTDNNLNNNQITSTRTVNDNNNMLDIDSDGFDVQTPSIQPSLVGMNDELLSMNSSILMHHGGSYPLPLNSAEFSATLPTATETAFNTKKSNTLFIPNTVRTNTNRSHNSTAMDMGDEYTPVYNMSRSIAANRQHGNHDDDDRQRKRRKKKKRGRNPKKSGPYQQLPYVVLPTSTSMKDNAKMTIKRREEVLVESDYGLSSDEERELQEQRVRDEREMKEMQELIMNEHKHPPAQQGLSGDNAEDKVGDNHNGNGNDEEDEDGAHHENDDITIDIDRNTTPTVINNIPHPPRTEKSSASTHSSMRSTGV